jgi:hypothetical protein
MRRVFSGLVLISLVTCSSTFAANVSNVDPAGSQKVQKPSRAARERQNNRQVSKARPDGRSESGSLSSAAAYAVEHSASLPISSAPKSTAPATNSWTGFYVGAGAGAAQP